MGCWVDALALVSEAGVCWRKAAKKVERKKGRWDDMVLFVAPRANGRIGGLSRDGESFGGKCQWSSVGAIACSSLGADSRSVTFVTFGGVWFGGRDRSLVFLEGGRFKS